MSDTIVPQVTLASEADFNQLVKYKSDSDCIEVDSTDYDSEELVNGKPVVTRSGRREYGLMYRRSQNVKPRH